ncbi:MAG: peptidase M16 [Hyphomicrobiales bacterium]|nr:insulinase family protein [Hyphomicrobiales bacterium]PCH50253.1 MAG: peptidase M16 [Hyphomicrobiales bacterium]
MMSVEVTKLKNGMTVVLNPMPHLETVALGTWIKAGSRNEDENEHGIAHFLEHMAFKGTKKRTSRQIVEAIEDVGGDINAATSIESTSYFTRLLGDDINLGMDVLHDILENSTFEEAEIEREKHVILQEIGAANDVPDDLVFDNFQDTAFDGQPIGRPILGTPETVKSFGKDDLNNYLGKHYRGPNMVLSASGKIDCDKLLTKAEELYSGFPSSLADEPVASNYIGGESFTKRDNAETQLVIGFEGRAYHARDFYASQLLSMILGGGMSSRLFQEVREKHGLCYSIYSFHWGFSDSGIFGVHAATETEDIPKLMPIILDELKRAAQDIDKHEVDRARAQIRAGLMMSMESPSSRATQLARQIMLFGRPVTNEELMDRLTAISTERITDLAGRLFTQSNPTIAAVGSVDKVMKQAEIADYLGSQVTNKTA